MEGLTWIVECAIHTVLYVRGVYPKRLFQRRRKFDALVYQSRHPTLNNYIAKVVKSVAEELLRVRLVSYIRPCLTVSFRQLYERL